MRILGLILGMAVVTYLPRLLPALIPEDFPFPDWLRKWLRGIPYAALGALIFPGVVQVDPEQPWLGLIGGAAAFFLALLKIHITLVMAGAVLVVLLVEQIL